MIAPVALLALACAPVHEEPAEYVPLLLPFASNGAPDWEAREDKPRHVVHITLDGKVHAQGEVVFDPESTGDDRYAKLDGALRSLTERMPREPLWEGGPEAPAGALLIRADLVGDFGSVLKVIELGAAAGLKRFHLAVADVRRPRRNDDGSLAETAEPIRYLPIDLPVGQVKAKAEPRTNLAVRVVEPGDKLAASHDKDQPWSGKEGTRFRWNLKTRAVAYQLGQHVTRDRGDLTARLFAQKTVMQGAPVRVQFGPGVTVGEAANLLDILRGFEVPDVRLVAGE